jgi:hypothetical protein
MNDDAVAGYEPRYCAFVDILGFRGLIDRLSHGETPFAALRTLLRRVHSTDAGEEHDLGRTDFRAQSISDAVAISTKPSDHGLAQLFAALERLTLDLLVQGFFVRGAVVKRPLYHDDHMVFGEALVQAYRVESEVACFPRIVVTREVRDDIIVYQMQKETSLTMKDLQQSDDGPMHLDVLKPVTTLLQFRLNPYNKLTQDQRSEYLRYESISRKIQQRFEESMDNPRHFEKVQWFARYWNNAIPRLATDFPRVHGAGLDQTSLRGR